MKQYLTMIFLFSSVLSMAQLSRETTSQLTKEKKEQIEESIMESIVSVKKMMAEGNTMDVSMQIDTIEKYLHKGTYNLKQPLRYNAIITLNGYYISKRIPKINYKELIEAVFNTQNDENFYDFLYWSCVYDLGIGYERMELYSKATNKYELVLKVSKHIFQGMPNPNDYDLLTKIEDLYWSKLKDYPKCINVLKEKISLSPQILGKDNEFYIRDLNKLSLLYQFNNQHNKSDYSFFKIILK